MPKDKVLIVPVQELFDCAEKIDSFAEANEDIFNRLSQSLQMMRIGKQWVGRSIDTVIQVTDANKGKYADTIAELKELSSFIKGFAKDLDKADTEYAAKIRSS